MKILHSLPQIVGRLWDRTHRGWRLDLKCWTLNPNYLISSLGLYPDVDLCHCHLKLDVSNHRQLMRPQAAIAHFSLWKSGRVRRACSISNPSSSISVLGGMISFQSEFHNWMQQTIVHSTDALLLR